MYCSRPMPYMYFSRPISYTFPLVPHSIISSLQTGDCVLWQLLTCFLWQAQSADHGKNSSVPESCHNSTWHIWFNLKSCLAVYFAWCEVTCGTGLCGNFFSGEHCKALLELSRRALRELYNRLPWI